MRRSLILTVAAAVSMVLLAMLVPMAVLLRDYALEDRLSRAALEVQATETVVAAQDRDFGTVAQYVHRINRGNGIDTTVLYPGDLPDIGPDPDPASGEDPWVVEARLTGTARIDDVDGGTEFLVPVSSGQVLPADTPVIRVRVKPPGLGSELFRTLLVLVGLGVVLLLGALVLADRLGRSFVRPIDALASYAAALGAPSGSTGRPAPPTSSGPPEVLELSAALTRLVGRIDVLLVRERESVSDLSHRLRTPLTALRLRLEQLPPEDAQRVSGDLDHLEATVDQVVRESRRSGREGLVAGADVVAVVEERVAFWAVLAEDQQRTLTVDLTISEPCVVRASQEDLEALLDVLLDNVFSHTPDGTDVSLSLSGLEGGGARLTLDDAGPGFPTDVDVLARGTSGAGSTGLGLSIAEKTATESGGGLQLGVSPQGGGRVVVRLGAAVGAITG